MATTSLREYKAIKLNGPVSVERVDSILGSDVNVIGYGSILIMGPTGSGKSTFIESLGLGNTEKISSNKLEGFTQTVTTYRMKNVTKSNGSLIYLVDSPGFADTKISVSAIVSMLQDWMQNEGYRVYFYHILYFIPITQVRMPGSQRQIIKTFKLLTGFSQAQAVTIVTSMWDSIWGDAAIHRAEATYRQLEHDTWKDYIKEGAHIVKFHNTHDSALFILDEAFREAQNNLYNMEDSDSISTKKSPFRADLCTDLQDRIQNLQSEILTTQSDLTHAKVHNDQQLCVVLRDRLEEAQKYLVKFQEELRDFGPPPVDLGPPHPVAEHGLIDHQSLTIDVAHEPNQEPIHEPFQEPIQETVQLRHRDGRLSRARDLIMRCGCCGKGVEANHDA